MPLGVTESLFNHFQKIVLALIHIKTKLDCVITKGKSVDELMVSALSLESLVKASIFAIIGWGTFSMSLSCDTSLFDERVVTPYGEHLGAFFNGFFWCHRPFTFS